MKAALALLNGLFNGLFNVPLFDTGVSFGAFLMAFVVLDVGFIILRHVLRNPGGSSGSGKSSGGSNE